MQVRGTATVPGTPQAVLQPPGRTFPGRMVSMSGKRPFVKVKLNPHAVWHYLNRLYLTQNALARLAGITSGYLSLLMNGKKCPSPDLRQRLQEILGVTRFEDLFIEVSGDE